MNRVVLVLAVASLLATTAYAIKCHTVDTEMVKDSDTATTCSGDTVKTCKKVYTEANDGEDTYVRSCGEAGEDKDTCTTDTESSDYKKRITCYCKTDSCNGADGRAASALAVAAALALSAVMHK